MQISKTNKSVRQTLQWRLCIYALVSDEPGGKGSTGVNRNLWPTISHLLQRFKHVALETTADDFHMWEHVCECV